MDETNLDQTQESQEQLDQSPSQEHLNEEQVDETVETTDESQEEEVQEDESDEELSPRQQKRIDQVESQAKEYKLNKILDRIQSAKPSQRQTSTDLLDFREAIDAPDEVYDTLDKDRQAAREQGRNEGLEAIKMVQFETNIKLDLPLVKDKLDKLDPADAAALDREYLLITGFDPATKTVQRTDIGYADFIDARMEQATRLASNMAQKSQRNIAKQAANTGVRPDGGGRQGIKINNAGDIANMSASDFEKNREAIYKAAGIPYQK